MRQPPVTTRLTIMLLYLTALVWQCFGLLAIFNMIPTIPAGPVRWIIGFLAIGCSIILTGITYFLNRHNRLAYNGTVGLMVLIIIASFLDDLGLSDIVLIVVDLTILGLLLKDRAWYLHPDAAGEKN